MLIIIIIILETNVCFVCFTYWNYNLEQILWFSGEECTYIFFCVWGRFIFDFFPLFTDFCFSSAGFGLNVLLTRIRGSRKSEIHDLVALYFANLL